MTIFFVTFGVIVFLVCIMAIGVIFGRRPIVGSCRGYDALGAECGAGCRTPCAKRRAVIARAREAANVEMNAD